MKIKLIAPARKPEWGESFWDLKTLCRLTGRKSGGAPLALPTLAALTPSDIEVVLTDENVERINFDEKVDLVGITGMTCVIPRSYEIAGEYRKRNVPVVMGGIHVSMLPDEAIQHCDSVVIGEAEEIWAQVIHDARANTLQKFYRAPRFPDLTNSPIPRWDLLKNDKYCYFTIQAGRGCPYDCDFCSVKVYNGREYRHKKIDQIVHEIQALKNIDAKRIIFFTDDNFLAVGDYAEELLQRMIPLKFGAWWCQSSLNKLRNDKVLDLMYKAGCRVVFVGFESVSQNSLEAMNKGHINKVDEYRQAVETAHAHGIAMFGSFVLGSDSDDPSIFEETAQFIDEGNIAFSMVNIITPFPGTNLYKNLVNAGRMSRGGWEKYNAEHVCFIPKSFSRESLASGRKMILTNIYAYEHMYKRLVYLWGKGVFLRTKNSFRSKFTRGRIVFSLVNMFQRDQKRKNFILRSLWGHGATSVSAIASALNYHDFAAREGQDGA